MAALNYCQMICGIIRGALEMVQLEVTARVEKVFKKIFLFIFIIF